MKSTKAKITLWKKDTCPICGRKYEYLGHRPSTCSSFQCMQTYHKSIYRFKSIEREGDSGNK